MQHCNVPTYKGDVFCGQCGDMVADKERLTITNVLPESVEKIKKHYLQATIITGEVISAYYYKRLNKSSSSSIQSAYWWLTVLDEQKQTHQFSISAEGDYCADVKKGDILTLVEPKGVTLLHKVQEREAREKVTNNDLMSCIVVHRESEQRSSIEARYSEQPSKPGTLWWKLFLGAMVVLAFWQNMPIDTTAVVAVVGALAIAIWEFVNNGKKHTKALERHADLNEALGEILNVTREDLGYGEVARPQHESDVICIHCSQRISTENQYCVHCGNQQAQVSQALIESEDVKLIDHSDTGLAPVAEEGDHQVVEALESELPSNNVTPLSVKDIQMAVLEENSVKLSADYLHKRSLARNSSAKVTSEFLLVKIIDTEISSDVSDVTTTTTYETKHYNRYGHSHSTYSTKTSRHRSATISSEVIGRLADGSTYTFTFAEHITRGVDPGDWLALADTSAEFDDETNLYNIEYAYNVSQEKEIHLPVKQSFMAYDDGRSISNLKGIGFLAALGVVGSLMTNSSAMAGLSIGLLVLATAWGIVMGSINIFQNNKRRQAVFAPMLDKIKLFQTRLPELKKRLAMID
ncbi:hypothetical protein [Vibrio sp. WXL210]|uniref:hypothetical protein n=1 Tax=Vibrio sp. WXL210 TaxID=3450709 RepID=UPI003EC7B509